MPRPRKPRTFADYPDVITVDDAAELLNVDRKAIYAEIHRGNLPAWRLGRRIRLHKNSLLALLSRPLDSISPPQINNQSDQIDIHSFLGHSFPGKEVA